MTYASAPWNRDIFSFPNWSLACPGPRTLAPRTRRPPASSDLPDRPQVNSLRPGQELLIPTAAKGESGYGVNARLKRQSVRKRGHVTADYGDSLTYARLPAPAARARAAQRST